MPDQPADSFPHPRGSLWKWWVCGLLLLATMLNYMDRLTLNLTSKRIMDELKLDPRHYGQLESAFAFAFALGAGINLASVWRAGLLGVLLGLSVIAISGVVLVVADKLTGGNGIAGIAAASTAANAAAVPAIVASANPAYAPAAPSATVLVAASVVVTALVTPLVTTWWAGRTEGPGDEGTGGPGDEGTKGPRDQGTKGP